MIYMLAAGAAAASTSTVGLPLIVQQQVELEGGEVAGYGQCQADEQTSEREVEEGQSEQEESVLLAS